MIKQSKTFKQLSNSNVVAQMSLIIVKIGTTIANDVKISNRNKNAFNK